MPAAKRPTKSIVEDLSTNGVYHGPDTDKIVFLTKSLVDALSKMSVEDKVNCLNYARKQLHSVSPFASEPVDCVIWVKSENVRANDYNPNSVAPPEMELLRQSIRADGYTQPIVGMLDEENLHEVIDGFHRNRVGKECKDVRDRVKGYLPVVQIRADRVDKSNRMASTIRHNRARGKHKVEAMSDIVVELKRRNWTDEKICKELGMDKDEVLRLCQITGLSELFSDSEFSRAWDVEGEVTEADFEELSDAVTDEEREEFRAVPGVNDDRVFHTYDKWECYKAGFYATHKDGMTKQQCEETYRDFLSDPNRFGKVCAKVISEWPNSCEHYLTNATMNRVAWLGQAAVCYATGVPSAFRGGFFLLTEEQRNAADEVALTYINKWMKKTGRPQITMADAATERQSELY